MPDDRTATPSHLCAACGTPLAPDQRYCVECGARRGPLSPPAARFVGSRGAATSASAGAVATPAPAAGAAALPSDAGDDRLAPRVAMPSPRAAAVAVMAVLAFGVVVGTLVSPPAESDASAPLVVAVRPAPAAAAAPTPAPVRHTAARRRRPTPAPAAAASPSPSPRAVDAPAPAAAPSAALPPAQFPTSELPAVRHVFLIVLSGQGYDASFGSPATAPYLAKTLTARGELIANYYGVARGELANQVALVSGQGPNPQTAADCPTYEDVTPGTVGKDGQAAGTGCVYPSGVQTVADQLTAAGSTWKAYVEGVDGGAPGEPASCRHPALGAPDPHAVPTPQDPYVTWRNPLAYFHSLIDTPACATGDVGLGALAADLKTAKDAPTLSYIVPDRCHDGSATPCAPGQPAGMPAADAFLRSIVPEILASPAYRDRGLVAITFDQAPQTGDGADSTGCCNEPAYPNLPAAPGAAPTDPAAASPTATATPAPDATATPAPDPSAGVTPAPTVTPVPGTPLGGGRVGLLLLSPFVKPGTVDGFGSFNHFSLLRSLEDLFALQHLGYAADPALPSFDASVYNAPAH